MHTGHLKELEHAQHERRYTCEVEYMAAAGRVDGRALTDLQAV